MLTYIKEYKIHLFLKIFKEKYVLKPLKDQFNLIYNSKK